MKITKELLNSLPQLDRIELRQKLFILGEWTSGYIIPIWPAIMLALLCLIFSLVAGQFLLASMQVGITEAELIFFRSSAAKFLTIAYVSKYLAWIAFIFTIASEVLVFKKYVTETNKTLSEYFETQTKVKRNERGIKNK